LNRSIFILGHFCFLVMIGVDLAIHLSGAVILGVFNLIGSILVFAVGLVWQLRQEEEKMQISRLWLALPIAAWGAAIFRVLNQSQIEYRLTPENLEEVGNLLMSRFDMGLWLGSLILLVGFIIAGTLMRRETT
jgi:NADH:ubiquinone oxidoreductase subunit 6 (subunit J)